LFRQHATIGSVGQALGCSDRHVRRILQAYEITTESVERAHAPKSWCSCAGCQEARAA
jgi:hypothetical protein